MSNRCELVDKRLLLNRHGSIIESLINLFAFSQILWVFVSALPTESNGRRTLIMRVAKGEEGKLLLFAGFI